MQPVHGHGVKVPTFSVQRWPSSSSGAAHANVPAVVSTLDRHALRAVAAIVAEHKHTTNEIPGSDSTGMAFRAALLRRTSREALEQPFALDGSACAAIAQGHARTTPHGLPCATWLRKLLVRQRCRAVLRHQRGNQPIVNIVATFLCAHKARTPYLTSLKCLEGREGRHVACSSGGPHWVLRVRARPTSATLATLPSRLSRTFADLRSRCTILFECKKCMPCATLSAMLRPLQQQPQCACCGC